VNKMEIQNKLKKNNVHRKFVFLLVIMFGLIAFLLIGLILLTRGQNQHFYKLAFTIITITLSIIGLLLLAIIFTVMLLWYDYPVLKISKKLLELSITTVYPIMLFLGKLLKYNKNTIRRAFTELNNKLVFSNEYNIEGKSILILTPHCIQKSFCPHKITTDIRNCKRCGKCNVDNLIELEDKYGIKTNIVTGGTLARKLIMDARPKAIIAIACERDLISGLQDVKKLPIIAVVNKRPEGPCVNTSVELDEVEKAIKHFLSSNEAEVS